jgi:hypothetical protein
MTHTTLGVLFRWLRVRQTVREQQYARRVPTIAAQLAAMKAALA